MTSKSSFRKLQPPIIVETDIKSQVNYTQHTNHYFDSQHPLQLFRLSSEKNWERSSYRAEPLDKAEVKVWEPKEVLKLFDGTWFLLFSIWANDVA